MKESQLKGCASIIHFVLDSINLRKVPNMIYYDICSFQPMEIYVDDEAKLTLHGLVQVCGQGHYILVSLLVHWHSACISLLPFEIALHQIE